MAWHEILGHQAVIQRFQRAAQSGRLSGAYLFVGPAGIGKRTLALQLAQALLCERASADRLEACDRCSSCTQVRSLSHPDLELVSRPSDKTIIPVELFIGDADHRMREGLCHRISLKPFHGSRKVAIIDDADDMNIEGANCLLKTLEEPPPRSVLILIATSLQKQLPTVRSRCQIVQFQPLDANTVSRLLIDRRLVEDAGLAERLGQLSEGSLQTALELADPSLLEYRNQLLTTLSESDWDPVKLAKEVNSFVEDVGKDAPPRRRRLRQLIAAAAAYYRQLTLQFSGSSARGDRELVTAVQRGTDLWTGSVEAAADCWQRCLHADQQVAGNAHLATLIDCWLDDVAEMARSTI
jgi:DNA polymerase III subunit delta'